MMEQKLDFLRIPIWYPTLAEYTFPTGFVKLRPEAVQALAEGRQLHLEDNDDEDPVVAAVIKELRQPMRSHLGSSFVLVDGCAPTDTERFELKQGAVYSPESAWKYLALSAKVRAAAGRGEVSAIVVRPFRRMNRTREFRLFIYEGTLAGMSQYHLIRHFRRLEGVRDHYWQAAQKFVADVAWKLPVKTLVLDLYFTSDDQILVLDLNPWGGTTDPLLFRTWERDWTKCAGLELMKPPTCLKGDVSVSF